MKRSLIALMALTVAPALSTAQTDLEADNYPVNFSRCDYIVSLPEGSGGYLHSRDCKTVYVLPARKGKFSAEVRLSDSMLEKNCESFSIHHEIYLKKSRALRETQDRLNTLEAAGGKQHEIDRLLAQAGRLQAELAEVKDPFRNVPGGQAYVRMEAGVTPELVHEFYRLNQQLVYANKVKFVPMPVRNGYLTITDYRPMPDTKFPSTLAIHANGVQIKGEGTGQNLYKMTSSMGGHVVMGMSLACDLLKKQTQARGRGAELSPQQLGRELIAEIAPSFSYGYPVMSTVKYAAKIDTERATKLLLDTQKVKSQFRVSQFSEMLGTGDASDIFTLDIDLGDLADRYTKEEDRTTFLANLTNDVRTRMAAKYLRELESIGLVKYEKEDAPEVPNPGYVTEPVGTVRTCSSDSFLGVTYNRSCRDRVVTRTVPVDGRMEDILRKVQDFKITVVEQLSIHELVLHGDNVLFE